MQSRISEKGNWIRINPEQEYHNQVWGWDMVPGRSHVNSSGRSFCILSSCIFTAHNPTKNYFLSRRITTFTNLSCQCKHLGSATTLLTDVDCYVTSNSTNPLFWRNMNSCKLVFKWMQGKCLKGKFYPQGEMDLR